MEGSEEDGAEKEEEEFFEVTITVRGPERLATENINRAVQTVLAAQDGGTLDGEGGGGGEEGGEEGDKEWGLHRDEENAAEEKEQEDSVRYVHSFIFRERLKE